MVLNNNSSISPSGTHESTCSIKVTLVLLLGCIAVIVVAVQIAATNVSERAIDDMVRVFCFQGH